MSGLNPNVLYEKASYYQDKTIDFWGDVPRSFQDVVTLAKNTYRRRDNDEKDKVIKLKKILNDFHKKMGIWTPKVAKNIELLDKGSVLMGQQPVIFGGPGYIGNKLGTLSLFDDLLKEVDHPLAPVFFIGDYDGIQKELVRQYFPNPISDHAIILDAQEYMPMESNITSHKASLPPYYWLENTLDELFKYYRGFIKKVKGDKKKILKERFDHLRTILTTSYVRSNTLSDWSIIIWGTIANIIEDKGIVFLPTSHPEIRKLVVDEYCRFITYHDKYVTAFDSTYDKLISMGYKPTLPKRDLDYAPFFLECPFDYTRIPTKIEKRDGFLFAEGECPNCKYSCSHNISGKDGLNKIATIIGPRVDTSQAIFQKLMNIQIRISGPGEIAYYSIVAPSVRSIGFETPIFVKYKRAFYNTNWIEKIGKLLSNRKQPSLHNDTLFQILRSRMKAIKDDDKQTIQDNEKQMQEFIQNVYTNIKQMKHSQDIQKYTGWQFGHFDENKFGQEVSWVWFDMALQTGLTDYIDTYRRMYSKHSLLGGIYYINTII